MTTEKCSTRRIGQRGNDNARSGVFLENQIGIVSRVGPGIGRWIALVLARDGADVALAARSETQLREVAAEVESF